MPIISVNDITRTSASVLATSSVIGVFFTYCGH